MPLHDISRPEPQPFYPGYEFGYDAITSNVNITGTTEGAATTVITCAAHTFDGAAVWATFRGLFRTDTNAAGDQFNIGLFETGSIIARFGSVDAPSTSLFIVTLTMQLRITPTAGSHTYTVQAWVPSTTGTPQILAGAGGTGVNSPASVSFTKV